jgi:ABC-type multidrug transport system permease subunit
MSGLWLIYTLIVWGMLVLSYLSKPPKRYFWLLLAGAVSLATLFLLQGYLGALQEAAKDPATGQVKWTAELADKYYDAVYIMFSSTVALYASVALLLLYLAEWLLRVARVRW